MEADSKKVTPIHRHRVFVFWLLTAITTIPFVSRFPFNWDAGQFILGAQHFSVAMHQPHPPGYPLFIFFGKLIGAILSPHWTFVGISLIAGAITVSATYSFLVTLWPHQRKIATTLALVLMTNPALWMFRSVGLTYTIDAAAMTLMALYTYRIMKTPQQRTLVVSAVVVALAGGFRPSLLTFVSPFLLLQWVYWWKATHTWKPILLQCIVVSIGVLVWATPLVLLSGGLAEYRAASGSLFGMVAADTSLLKGATVQQAIANAGIFVKSVIASWNISIIVVGVAAIVWVFRSRRVNRDLCLLGIAWCLVPVWIYAFVHFGQIGYVVIFVPLLAVTMMPVARWIHNRSVVLWATLMVTLLLVNCGAFFLVNPRIAHPGYIAHAQTDALFQRFAQHLSPFVRMNRQSIIENDTRMERLVQGAQEFAPTELLIISTRNLSYITQTGLPANNASAFRELGALLPQYQVIDVSPDRQTYMQVTHAETTTIPRANIRVPREVTHVLIVAEHIETNDLPKGIQLEQQEGYYIGSVEGKDWSWLGYTFVQGKRSDSQ